MRSATATWTRWLGASALALVAALPTLAGSALAGSLGVAAGLLLVFLLGDVLRCAPRLGVDPDRPRHVERVPGQDRVAEGEAVAAPFEVHVHDLPCVLGGRHDSVGEGGGEAEGEGHGEGVLHVGSRFGRGRAADRAQTRSVSPRV